MVVAVDVVGDLLSCLVEGLEVGAPDEPLLQFPEPAFDEGLRFGVAVAAAAVGDAVLGESCAEAAAGEGAAVVGAERQLAAFDVTCGDRCVDEVDGFVGAAAQLERPADDLARATVDRGVEVGPAVLGDPDTRHVEVPELIGTLDAEVARTTTPAKRSPFTVERPILRGAPDTIVATARPYRPRLRADRAPRQTSTRRVSTRYRDPGQLPCSPAMPSR